MNTLICSDLFFVSSCKTQEVFDWWSKYDASLFEDANAAEDKVLKCTVIIVIINDDLNLVNQYYLDFIHAPLRLTM